MFQQVGIMDGTFRSGRGAKSDPVYPWAPSCSLYHLPMLANQAFWAFLKLKKSWINLVWLYSIFSVKTNIPISVVERRWSGTLLILLENSCRSWSTTLKSLGKTNELFTTCFHEKKNRTFHEFFNQCTMRVNLNFCLVQWSFHY